MDELKRLVKLVIERSSKSSPLINYQDEDSLETKLFHLIKSDEIETDEVAAETLYGTRNSSANYRMLKSRVRKKLLNHLHFLRFPESKYRVSGIESYNCSALTLEAQCLVLASEYSIAEKVVNQAIALAKENQLNNNIVKALEIKQSIYITTHNARAFEETHKELQKYYEVEAKERAALRLYYKAVMELSSNVSARNKFFPEIPKVLQEIKELWESSFSSLIYNAYHVLGIHYLELCGDYKAIDEAVERAEQLLKEGHVHSGWFNHRYNYFIRIYALLRTRQYETGLKFSEEYLQLFDAKTVNWFAFMENYLLLALHSKNYNLAGSLMQKSLSNPHIKIIQNAAKERWELYRRYLLLMHTIIPELHLVNLPKRVTTEFVMLPKDKVGFNLSLLVLDIIRSFLVQSLDDYEPQALRIRKYISKYLRGEKSERPRLFLRLLLLVIKEGFHPVRAKEKGQKLYKKLSHVTPPGDAFAEVEIIPYEHLWELVLKVLDKKAS